MVAFALRRLARPLMGPDVAVDLGTAYLRVAREGERGIHEGRSALPTRGANGEISSRWYPALRRGVVADIGAAAEVLERAFARGRRPGRVLACIPSDATETERSALFQATKAAGAGEVAIVPEPTASAIGSGLDMSDARARMLVDIGDGVTDLAVFRSGEMVSHHALRVACGDLRDALVEFLHHTRTIDIGPDRADLLVRWAYNPGAGFPLDLELPVDDVPDGAMRDAGELLHEEILEAVAPVEAAIVRFVFDSFLALPDETAADVIESGLCVTGGGALLAGLVEAIRVRTGLDVSVPRDPLHSVINGAVAMLPVAARTGLWQS